MSDAAANVGRAKQGERARAAPPADRGRLQEEFASQWPTRSSSHHFYPPEVRARVVEVLLRPCALFFFHKDSRMATEMVDAFEASLVKYVVAAAEWR